MPHNIHFGSPDYRVRAQSHSWPATSRAARCLPTAENACVPWASGQACGTTHTSTRIKPSLTDCVYLTWISRSADALPVNGRLWVDSRLVVVVVEDCVERAATGCATQDVLEPLIGLIVCDRPRFRSHLNIVSIPPDLAGRFSEGGEIIRLHLEGPLTIPAPEIKRVKLWEY